MSKHNRTGKTILGKNLETRQDWEPGRKHSMKSLGKN